MKNKIDINCDLGEGMGHDEAIMPFITSASIACGYHAGDIETIRRTIYYCIQNNVGIGAHPSFHDRHNFGRTEMHLSPEELYELIYVQIQLIDTLANQAGSEMLHVKAHGALYNMAARDPEMAAIFVKAIRDYSDQLVIYGLSGSHLIAEAKRAGMKAANEAFADRTYTDDGQLTPRREANALISNSIELRKHVLPMINDGIVISTSGKEIPIEVDTICIHGDGPNAPEFAKELHSILHNP